MPNPLWDVIPGLPCAVWRAGVAYGGSMLRLVAKGSEGAPVRAADMVLVLPDERTTAHMQSYHDLGKRLKWMHR